MLTAVREALNVALTYAEDQLTSATIERIEPRHLGEIYGFNVTTKNSEHPALMFVDSSQPTAPMDTERIVTVTDADTGNMYRVWTYPFDPDLPTLPAATVPDGAAVLLERLGIPATNTTLNTVSYRPGRRAVVHLESDDADLYLKIVRPSQVESIVNLHRDFGAAGLPVPPVIAWSPDGLILFETLPGSPLANHLPQALASEQISGDLPRLISHIQTVQTEHQARGGSLERIDWYGSMLSQAFPDQVDRIRRLETAVAAWLPHLAQPCVRHGDLHVDQIMVNAPDADQILGLLDIDTAGLANYDTDGAFFIADLLVRCLNHQTPEHDRAVARACIDHFGKILRPHPVLVGAQLMAHALGPAVHSDEQEKQRALTLIDTAEQWIQSVAAPAAGPL